LKYAILFLTNFIIGSVPFPYLIGKIFFKTDIRTFGDDNNPGSVNAFKAKGLILGIPSLFLDYLKGAIPLYFFISKFNLNPFIFCILSNAPILGHMFTPFLKFRGGKGITTTFGVWSALTLWKVPTFLGSIFLFFVILKPFFKDKISDRLIVVTASVLLVVFVFFQFRDPRLTYVSILNSIILIFGQYKEEF